MAELRVLRGEPSAEELAALVVVLWGVLGRAGPDGEDPPPRGWADRAAAVPGRPGAWRRSGLPG
ncbi:acyl-CoA carboxylase subunit epsilon [Amycolatopsis sp. CA-126428]|uniref:acyl-CoA carboxylase subunit epsilon n=1 Tax=Amycolatopsis sp. CA-126428 TaxID=2073158 RepID=UPI000CD16964|nr:acyl-CoA carboxylase subunit epsilon [Amycolatopsis sp. CA-126428]